MVRHIASLGSEGVSGIIYRPVLPRSPLHGDRVSLHLNGKKCVRDAAANGLGSVRKVGEATPMFCVQLISFHAAP